MTIPEIPPAHREAMVEALTVRFTDTTPVIGSERRAAMRVEVEPAIMADAAIATMLALGYRVAPGWVIVDPTDSATWPPDDDSFISVAACGTIHTSKASITRCFCHYGNTHVAWLAVPPPPSAPAPTTDNTTSEK